MSEFHAVVVAAVVAAAVASGLGIFFGYRTGYGRARAKATMIAEATFSMDQMVAETGLLTPDQHLRGLQTNVRNTFYGIKDL